MTPPDRERSGDVPVVGPTVAGTWYPSSPDELGRQIDALLRSVEAAEPAYPSTTCRALIAPHAGFVYSGAVAARVFRSVDSGASRRVLLIGPSHYADFRGLRVPRASAYRTPLGDVAIDLPAVRQLERNPLVRIDPAPFTREHCLEAELPFLQRVLGEGWELVPMLIGASTTTGDRTELASSLAPLMDPDTLLVVSSDFTHYGSAFHYLPFRTDVPQKIRRLDMGAVDRIVSLEREGFERYVRETGATICGRAAIDVLLALVPEHAKARLVDYDTSGRQTGDWTHSVSYAAVGFWW
jgi:AmmeMemoRadiSam system protein B